MLDQTTTPVAPPVVTLEHKTLSFKAGDTTGLQDDEFQGYLAAFNNVDETGDVILPGAFTNTIPDFLANGVVCWQHDFTTPIGKWLEAREDGYGLFVKGRISLTTAGKDALILLRDGVIKKLSIGYQPLGYRILSEKEGVDLLGQSAYDAAMRELPWYMDGIRALTDIKLYEGSPVTVPANPRAAITGVKDGAEPHAGLPFAALFSTVLAANEELFTRTKGIADLRRKEGRVLSSLNREKLTTMRSSLAEHMSTLDELLAAATPDAPSSDPDGNSTMLDPGEGTERGNGGKSAPVAEVEQKSAGETPQPAGPSPEELAAELRRELARFLQTEARLNGALV